MNQTEIQVLKKEVPTFIRHRAKNIKKLKKSWRRPRGLHNKLRLKLRGHGKRPSIGYGSNKNLKGTYLGLAPVIVKNLEDLRDMKDRTIIISRYTGLKKKLLILNKAKELKLEVLNIKDIDKFLKKAKDELKKRKDKTKKNIKEKTVKKKVEKKEDVEEKKETKEEKEKREKLEKKKVLEDKQAIRKGGSV